MFPRIFQGEQIPPREDLLTRKTKSPRKEGEAKLVCGHRELRSNRQTRRNRFRVQLKPRQSSSTEKKLGFSRESDGWDRRRKVALPLTRDSLITERFDPSFYYGNEDILRRLKLKKLRSETRFIRKIKEV